MLNLVDNARNLWKITKFISGGTGKEYSISKYKKLILMKKIILNNKKMKSLSTWQQHLVLVEEIFNTPKSLQGDIVECGCFNGASTATLSLACALTNRKLFVCDSFEGLSVPTKTEEYEVSSSFSDYLFYKKGDYSADGGLDGVKSNVERYGNPEVCSYVKGYFSDTLADLESKSIIMVFEDADLPSSVQDCLQHLWPKLQDDCKFYCHEPWSVKVVSVFYDENWWQNTLGSHCPGFYGSGGGSVPGMGYSIKFNAEKIISEGSELKLNFTQEKGDWKGVLSPRA